MKSKAIVLIICLCGLLLMLSQAIAQEEMTAEQQKQYERLKLSVEVREIGMGSYGGGGISYASWRKWTAYEGFTKISEEKFFRKAGYEREAGKAAGYRRKGNLLFWGGTGAVVAGLTMAVVGMGEDGNAAVAAIGIVMSIGGLFPMYLAVGYKQSNWAPYSTVEGIAEEYNRELRIRVIKEF